MEDFGERQNQLRQQLIPRGKTSPTKRSSGPGSNKRKKLEATGVGVEEIYSQTRMSLQTTEATPRQTPKVDRKKQDPSLKRRSIAPKEDAGKLVRP